MDPSSLKTSSTPCVLSSQFQRLNPKELIPLPQNMAMCVTLPILARSLSTIRWVLSSKHFSSNHLKCTLILSYYLFILEEKIFSSSLLSGSTRDESPSKSCFLTSSNPV